MLETSKKDKTLRKIFKFEKGQTLLDQNIVSTDFAGTGHLQNNGFVVCYNDQYLLKWSKERTMVNW